MTTALTFQGVVKKYRRIRALDGLDLSVPAGSIFGLVGSNGAGKTTAMAVAVGLLRPHAGTVDLFGEGAFDPQRHGGRVAVLPQDSRPPPHARVAELLRFYGGLQGVRDPELTQAVDTLLDWVHLRDRARSAVRTLSHGMTRRLTVAQAFLGSPELVLLDEPLNGLDPREAARVRDLIRGRRGRQTIVISSHNLADIEALCDHVAFVEHGRLVRQDTLAAITRQSHRVTFVLAPCTPPLEALRAALPEVDWAAAQEALTATFAAPLTAAELNARALPVLLQAGIPVLEIHRGSDLESEYLRASAADAPCTKENPR
jgi:ABC-type multidrug transport system ATPase subunit